MTIEDARKVAAAAAEGYDHSEVKDFFRNLAIEFPEFDWKALANRAWMEACGTGWILFDAGEVV